MSLWSDEETALLKALWARKATQAEVLQAFPGRSKGAIHTKASFMRLGTRSVQPKWSPALGERAIAMRKAGHTDREIARALGFKCGDTIREWLDPQYRVLRRRRAREAKQGIPRGLATNKSTISTESDAVRLAARIPPDTRDLTARLCGDPLPGRRAIDMRI